MSPPRDASDPGAGPWRDLEVVRRITDARPRTRVTVTAMVTSVRTTCWRGMRTCAVDIDDGTGPLALHFTGRGSVAGISAGTVCEVEGTVMADEDGTLLVWNPGYTLIADPPGGDGPSRAEWPG